jgi:tRNA threonylcarbamoyladenosine biosynthesis protein TsaB
MLLAIDTSTLTTSAALLDGGRVVAERDALATPHSEALLPLIDALVAEAGVTPAALTHVACGVGPGSFTGLRIGLATAKGLCFSLGVPLVAVSSLAALALEGEAAAGPGGLVLAVTDARRGEIYAGLYRLAAGPGGAPEALVADAVRAPEVAAREARAAAGAHAAIHLVGDGIAVAPAVFASLGAVVPDARVTPRAAAVGRIALARLAALAPGQALDELGSAAPAYLRATAAEEKLGPR